MTEHGDGFVVVPENACEYLHDRQLLDHRTHREQLIKWMLNPGKDLEKAEGYAHKNARQRAYRLDRFYRWVW